MKYKSYDELMAVAREGKAVDGTYEFGPLVVTILNGGFYRSSRYVKAIPVSDLMRLQNQPATGEDKG